MQALHPKSTSLPSSTRGSPRNKHGASKDEARNEQEWRHEQVTNKRQRRKKQRRNKRAPSRKQTQKHHRQTGIIEYKRQSNEPTNNKHKQNTMLYILVLVLYMCTRPSAGPLVAGTFIIEHIKACTLACTSFCGNQLVHHVWKTACTSACTSVVEHLSVVCPWYDYGIKVLG